MKKLLPFLYLLALMSCDALTSITAPAPTKPISPPAPLAERIFRIDNQSEFGVGNLMAGFNFDMATMTDSSDLVQLIIAPIKTTDNEIIAPMMYHGAGKDYELVMRFGESYFEANYFYDNYIFIRPDSIPLAFKHTKDMLNTQSFQYTRIEGTPIDVQKNDIWLYDNRILILVLSQSVRNDGYVNMHFRYKKI